MGEFYGIGHELRERVDGVDEAPGEGLLRAEALGGEDHFPGAALADDAGYPLDAAVTGDDAEGGFRHGEGGVFRGEADIGGKGHFKAAAEGVAVDRRDDGNGKCFEFAHDAIAVAGEVLPLLAVHVFHFLDVCACDKGFFARTGDDEAADIGILYFVEQAGQLQHRRRIKGIHDLLPVYGYDADLVFDRI